jgi:hypothetical protein
MDQNAVNNILLTTYAAAASSGFAGFDPYDVKAVRILGRLGAIRYAGFATDRILSLVPMTSRRLFRVRPAVNPKTLALFSLGCSSLFRTTGDQQWLQRAGDALELLLPLATKTAHGKGWGYPFNWQSRMLIPAGTPSGVVTSFCVEAFVEYTQQSGDQRFVPHLQEALSFLARDLNRFEPSAGLICFSYTPLDRMRVHNANLLVASALARGGNVLRTEAYDNLSEASTRYSLAQQNEDGSWKYYGNEDGIPGHVDNYHTGFVLRSLAMLRDHQSGLMIDQALDRGLQFYLDHLFFREFLPRHTVTVRYPVDIHACADAICTLSRFNNADPRARGMLDHLIDWTLDHLYDGRGGFYYQYYPFYTSKICFMRWNNAWSFYGLSHYAGVLRGTP